MKRNWSLFLVAVLLSALIAYRSYSLPITHDEASTWLNYRHLNMWSCISNAVCWSTANNHWLNTLLLQFSAGVFGDVPWALRLPNVLAGFSYILCSILISTRYINNTVSQFSGFVLLCGHVYLLDFFSLARGYGIMTAGVIWGVYFMLRYIEKSELRWLMLAIFVLSLGILGNFTALLPWAAIGLAWAIWMLINKDYRLFITHGLVWLLNAGVLFALLRFPIKTLAASGEFEWGAKNIYEMCSDLIINLVYGERVFGENTAYYILIAFCILIILIFCIALLKKNKRVRTPVLFMILLLVLNVLIVVLHQKITGSYAPIGRKSIYLIPFIFGTFALGLQFIQKRIWAFVFGTLISLIFLFRIPRNTHMDYSREWYFDRYYPEVFSVVLPEGHSSDSIYLSSSWIFNPSLVFYQKTIPLPIGGLPYQRPLVIDSTMDFYYVEASDSLGMHSGGFKLDRNIGSYFLFMNVNSKK